MKNLFALMCLLAFGLGGVLQAQDGLPNIQFTASLDDSDNQVVGFNFSGTLGEKFIIRWGDGENDTVLMETTDEIEVSHVVKSTHISEIGILAMNPTGHILSLSIDSIYHYCSITVYNCPEITTIRVSHNKLETLYIYPCPALKILDCSYNNIVSFVNINECATSLTHLDCSHNRIIHLPYLNGHKALISLHCEDNRITDLRARAILTLREVYCQNNQISVFELDSNPVLERLDCSNNDLPFSPSSVGCPNLAYLDISDNEHLESFGIYDNQRLESIDLSRNPGLRYVYIINSNIKSLDFSANPKLESLDLHGLPTLQYLSCRNTMLSNLSFSADDSLLSLQTVECTANSLLERLDLTDCPSLDSLDFSDNIQLNDLVISNTGLRSLDLSVTPNLEKLSCIGNDSLTTLHIDNPKLEYLYLHDLPALQYLSCRNTMLPGLSFSADNSLPSLQTLECLGNPLLERLELTNCPLLDSLKFADNTQLKALTIGHTKLRSLDLSVAPNLKTLYCKPKLTSLKLSSDVLLEWLVCDSNCLTLSNVADLVNSSLDVTVSPQLIPILRQVGHTLDLRSEMNINDEATKWNVLDSVGNIITDYTNTGWEGYRNGHFFFTKTGRYRIALHHDALLRHDGVLMPADVYYDVTVVDSVARPVFSEPSGAVRRHTSVSLSTITSDARIYYTTDGSVPDSMASLYTEPIYVDEAVTIKAIAIQDTFTSRVATASYTIDLTANESDKATERVRIYVKNRSICLSESIGEVSVFTAGGQCVYRGSATAIPVKRSGLYVVVAKGGRWKVTVR